MGSNERKLNWQLKSQIRLYSVEFLSHCKATSKMVTTFTYRSHILNHWRDQNYHKNLNKCIRSKERHFYPRTRRKTASSSRYWSRFICGGTHRWKVCCEWTWFCSCNGSDAGTTSLTPEKSEDFAPRPSTFVTFHSSTKTRRWRKTCKRRNISKQRRGSRHHTNSRILFFSSAYRSLDT